MIAVVCALQTVPWSDISCDAEHDQIQPNQL